ncbi:hypothetical protein PHISCL_06640 [Aspergillus sclerotialis]|uniref:Uncharacterized protein n=1 Tax=Aspergillus sclerotialis TaxID=2070753 RepID=A0A3A2ZCY7_9EURO|nr:hypothetical protein PHISCL_06640 [Aspergillus sclerotialis]
MLPKSALLLAIAGNLSVVASPSGKSACEQVTDITKKSMKDNASSDFVVPGGLAYDCLQSMPFYPQRGAEFITELKKYMQWQSTLDVLKDPPPGYQSAPVDLLAGLDEIQANTTNEQYKSQFEFDNALESLLASAHDRHLRITPCSHSVLGFKVNLPLISVSTDGLQLPKVYTLSDAGLLTSEPDRVSPVVSINGQDAASYFNEFALTQREQDPDARYNQLFRSTYRFESMSNNFSPYSSWEYNNGLWPGDKEFKVKFANGTSTVAEVTAIKQYGSMPFNYKDGKQIFDLVCMPHTKEELQSILKHQQQQQKPSASSETSSASSESQSPLPSGYPKPVTRADDNSISGYYLDTPDFKDVAVLFIPTFEPGDNKQFADTATKFINGSKAAGKKKLIIDLSFNPGGTIDCGLDLFKLFFPQEEIYTATRYRAHEAMDLIGRALSRVDLHNETTYMNTNGFLLKAMVTPNQKYQYQTWPEAYGPHEELGSKVSSLMAINNFTLESNLTDSIRGYGPVKKNPKEQPFAAEDILLVTNGACSSTCTIFSELMKNQGGVRSLAFGGRPQLGPMQALGGVKGQKVANDGQLELLYKTANEVADNATKEGHPVLSEAQHKRLKELTPRADDENAPILGLSRFDVNLINGYRPGQEDMPLQFVYEPADCRLFFTAENIVRPASGWEAAAKAFWGDGRCVEGSERKTRGDDAAKHRRRSGRAHF